MSQPSNNFARQYVERISEDRATINDTNRFWWCPLCQIWVEPQIGIATRYHTNEFWDRGANRIVVIRHTVCRERIVL